MRKAIISSILIILLGMLVSTPIMASHGEAEDPRDPDLVYFEVRANLEESDIVGHGAPALVEIPIGARTGVYKGYLLPIWSDPVNLNDELYFSICIPDRWDGENDFFIAIVTALTDKGEGNNAYRLHTEMETVRPNFEVVPNGFMSADVQRDSPLSNDDYYCYRDWITVDTTALGILHDNIFSWRLQRIGALAPATDNLTGDLIVLHVGVLFPRGDLLGDPSSIVTEEDMEEIGIQFGVFNGILAEWAVYFLIFFGLLFILGISYLAFWKPNPVLFMLLAGASVIFGFAWYDAFTTNLGLALGLMMVIYAIICVGFAFRCIFWKEKVSEE